MLVALLYKDFGMVWCMSDACGSRRDNFLFLAFYPVRNGCVLVKGNWEFKVLSSWPLKKSSPPVKWQGLLWGCLHPVHPTGCLDKERSSFSITRLDNAMTYMNTEFPALFFFGRNSGGCDHLCAFAWGLLTLHGGCWIEAWCWNLCSSTHPYRLVMSGTLISKTHVHTHATPCTGSQLQYPAFGRRAFGGFRACSLANCTCLFLFKSKSHEKEGLLKTVRLT